MTETDTLLLKYAALCAVLPTLTVATFIGLPSVSFIICAGLFGLYHAQRQL